MNILRKWFTLIELLVVVIIIGLLAIALIPKMSGFQARARDVARKSDMQQISQALATYKINNGIYLPSPQLVPISNILTPLVTGHIMTKLPQDPYNELSHPYQYATATDDNQTYLLATLNEWWGINANYAQSFFAMLPINIMPNPTILWFLNNVLFCKRVDQWTPNRLAWWNCSADLAAKEALYMIAN